MFNIVVQIPEYQANIDYQQKFWGIYIQNQQLMDDFKKAQIERKDFRTHIENFKVNFIFWPNQVSSNYSEIFTENIGRKKHLRRTAKDIEKVQDCPYVECDKKYGSEGSLNLHMKLKHAAGNKTDREKLAVSFCWLYFGA